MNKLTLLIFALILLSPGLSGYAQQNNDAKKLFNEGNSELKAGNYSGAVSKYREAIRHENHEFYQYQLGLALRKSKKETEAIAAFTESVRINPKFAAGYNALGGGYFALKDYEKSMENYGKALAETPTLGPAKKGLAAAQTARANELVSRGEIALCLDLAKKAVENNPKMTQAYVIMAQAYNKDAKYNEAIQAADKAISSNKAEKNGPGYFEMGIAYRNLGNMPKAKEAFLQAKKDPMYSRNAEYELKQLK